MKQFVKTLGLFTISVLCLLQANSQLKLPSAGSNLAPDIRKVIEDYPNRFVNLQGELLIEHPQSTDYACNFKVNGAEEARVTVYSSKHQVSSWEALMLTTDEFSDAKKKFRALFTELNNLSVKMGGTIYHMKGDYEAPKEEKKFTSVVFSFGDTDEAMKKLKVEITMTYEPMEWKVKVMIYDRDREDAERGPREEN